MAEKTYKNYVSKFRVFDAWLAKNGLAGNDLRTIDQETMSSFILYLINDLKLAKITIAKYKHMIERFFNWAIKNKHIKTSPMINLPETTRENDQAPRPINENDINKLVEKIKETDRQLWLTVQMEYYCLMRPGLEIRFAKVGWFDLARGVINVPKEFIKTRENKTVIIPNQFREHLLNEWKLHLYPTDYYVIGKNGIPGKEFLGSNNLRNRFNIIRDSLHLPKEYKLYSFKHTGNSRLIDTNVPVYHIQRQNGHSSMRSTEQYFKNKIGFSSPELQNSYPSL
jgi:integrase